MKQNVLDEREQQVLGQIEHHALNAAEILLILAIVVQLLLGADFRQIAGECMVMVVLTIGMIAAYVHSGIWDTDAAPSSGGNYRRRRGSSDFWLKEEYSFCPGNGSWDVYPDICPADPPDEQRQAPAGETGGRIGGR